MTSLRPQVRLRELIADLGAPLDTVRDSRRLSCCVSILQDLLDEPEGLGPLQARNPTEGSPVLAGGRTPTFQPAAHLSSPRQVLTTPLLTPSVAIHPPPALPSLSWSSSSESSSRPRTLTSTPRASPAEASRSASRSSSSRPTSKRCAAAYKLGDMLTLAILRWRAAGANGSVNPFSDKTCSARPSAAAPGGRHGRARRDEVPHLGGRAPAGHPHRAAQDRGKRGAGACSLAFSPNRDPRLVGSTHSVVLDTRARSTLQAAAAIGRMEDDIKRLKAQIVSSCSSRISCFSSPCVSN